MLKQKSKILFCIFLISILVSSVCFATDAEQQVTTTSDEQVTTTGDTETVGTTESTEPEWINDDLYVFEKDIVIDKIVDGNVFACGTNVTIKSEVGGELFVFAENLVIEEDAYIYCGLYGFAKKVTIKGTTYDVYLASEDFTLDTKGIVYRDLRVIGNKITINGKIRRNAHIISNDISFPDNEAHVGNDFNYYATNELNIPTTAVLGNINFNKMAEVKEESLGSTIVSKIVSTIMSFITSIVTTLVVTLLAMWLTPVFIKKVSNMSIGKSALSLAIGLGAFFGVLIVTFIALFTVVLVPVSISLLTLYLFILFVFATPVTSIVISGIITKKFNIQKKWLFILISLAVTTVLFILSLIPFVNFIIGILNNLFALGTLTFSLFLKAPVEENK